MSMISGLIDELNKSADEWNGSNMFELARMCREAAGTITELRGALQVASVDYRHLQDENAKLRELLAKARDPRRIGGTADPESFVYAIEQLREFRWQHATNDEEAIPYINNVADAHERENAKLRELVRTFYHCTTSGECDECPINGGGPVRLMPDTICDTIHDRMRELGVEV